MAMFACCDELFTFINYGRVFCTPSMMSPKLLQIGRSMISQNNDLALVIKSQILKNINNLALRDLGHLKNRRNANFRFYLRLFRFYVGGGDYESRHKNVSTERLKIFRVYIHDHRGRKPPMSFLNVKSETNFSGLGRKKLN